MSSVCNNSENKEGPTTDELIKAMFLGQEADLQTLRATLEKCTSVIANLSEKQVEKSSKQPDAEEPLFESRGASLVVDLLAE